MAFVYWQESVSKRNLCSVLELCELPWRYHDGQVGRQDGDRHGRCNWHWSPLYRGTRGWLSSALATAKRLLRQSMPAPAVPALAPQERRSLGSPVMTGRNSPLPSLRRSLPDPLRSEKRIHDSLMAFRAISGFNLRRLAIARGAQVFLKLRHLIDRHRGRFALGR